MGKLQCFEHIAPGIMSFSTASHGGYFLTTTANRLIPPLLKATSHCSHAFDSWYEEDCDWAIVVVYMKDHFEMRLYRRAIDTLKQFHPIALDCLRLLKRVS